MQRIAKNLRGRGETDPVFGPVSQLLGRVPLKLRREA